MPAVIESRCSKCAPMSLCSLLRGALYFASQRNPGLTTQVGDRNTWTKYHISATNVLPNLLQRKVERRCLHFMHLPTRQQAYVLFSDKITLRFSTLQKLICEPFCCVFAYTLDTNSQSRMPAYIEISIKLVVCLSDTKCTRSQETQNTLNS
jgi:hypothetical protein